jgi:osmotically-inducible protein OsmY
MKNTQKLVTLSALALLLGAPSHAQAETTGQYVDDATITAKVKTDLMSDNELKAMHISVTTNQGEVRLGGLVDSASQESEAIKIANQVDGVKSVQDVMTVRGSQDQ